MKQALTVCVFLTLALWLGCGKASQPTAPGIIYGTVIDTVTRQPVPNAKVVLRTTSTDTSWTTTGATGQFTFSGVSQGRYDIQATKDNYYGLLFNVPVTAGQNTAVRITLKLKPWLTRAGMQFSRTGLAAVVLYNEIFAIGGRNGNTYLSVVERYDPSATSPSWSTSNAVPCSTERCEMAAVVYNGQIYLFGGRNSNGHLRTAEVFNPSLNSWSYLPPMRWARAGLAAAVFNGKIFVIGGDTVAGSGRNPVHYIERFDPVAGIWDSIYYLNTPRTGHSAVVIGGRIYAVGGFGGDYLRTYDYSDANGRIWSTSAYILPKGRTELSVGVYHNRMYIFGGKNASEYFGDTYSYPPDSNLTIKLPMPARRAGLAVAVRDSLIFTIGGTDGAVYLNSVDMYNPAYDR